jgi:hypothetical protein
MSDRRVISLHSIVIGRFHPWPYMGYMVTWGDNMNDSSETESHLRVLNTLLDFVLFLPK